MANEREATDFLMVGNDPADRVLAQQALEQHQLGNGIRFVENGDELIDYLHHRGKYADPVSSPRPGAILLDLDTSRTDGRQALEEIKRNPELLNIPVVVLISSKNEEDILRSCELGANAYITKPLTLVGLGQIMKSMAKFWFESDKLPSKTGGA